MWEQLIKFIKKNNIQEAEKLISQLDEQELNRTDSKGRTALHLAARNSQKNIVKMLLEKMSLEAINSFSNNGYTALHFSFIIDEFRLTKQVEKPTLSVEEKFEIYIRMLSGANKCSEADSEIVRMLTEKMRPEDFYRTDKLGNTIVHSIAKWGGGQLIRNFIFE